MEAAQEILVARAEVAAGVHPAGVVVVVVQVVRQVPEVTAVAPQVLVEAVEVAAVPTETGAAKAEFNRTNRDPREQQR